MPRAMSTTPRAWTRERPRAATPDNAAGSGRAPTTPGTRLNPTGSREVPVPRLARSPAQPGEHGTRAGYRGGCRCEPCRRADREYARRRYRLKAYGQWQPFTDAAPVREHVRRLMSLGI